VTRIVKLHVLLVALCAVAAACHRDATAPAVPLELTVTARRLDNAPLPVVVEERPGTTDSVVDFALTFASDGSWQLYGHYEPVGARQTSALPEFWDNGDYTFDGTTLTLHSNFTHASWPAMLRADTLTTTLTLPFASAPHEAVLWP
jgi:hypothetical protein